MTIISGPAIYWGDISLLDAELMLFHKASESNEYMYYHLISGQDLPVNSQSYIHEFCDNVKTGTNFLGYDHGSECDRQIASRTTYYIPFTKYLKTEDCLKTRVYNRLRENITRIQKKLGIRRHKSGIVFKKGCEWASMTDEFVRYILSQKENLKKTFRGVPCCDELYKQTLAWNSKFKDTIYDLNDEYMGCLRQIDWKRGNPYTYTEKDEDILIASDRFFARKFDSAQDRRIIDIITSNLVHKHKGC